MYLRHTATDYNLHIPAVKTAGYPYPVPTGLLHAAKQPYTARQRLYPCRRHLTRCKAALHGAAAPLPVHTGLYAAMPPLHATQSPYTTRQRPYTAPTGALHARRALHGATRPYCQKKMPVNPLLHLKIPDQKNFFRKYARILVKSLTVYQSMT